MRSPVRQSSIRPPRPRRRLDECRYHLTEKGIQALRDAGLVDPLADSDFLAELPPPPLAPPPEALEPGYFRPRRGTINARWRQKGNVLVPELRMSGFWLEQAGFDIGQRFEVAVEHGVLTFRAV